MTTHPDQSGPSSNPNKYNYPAELPSSLPAELAGDDYVPRPHPLQAHPVGADNRYDNTPTDVGHHEQHIHSPMSTAQTHSPQPSGQGFFPPPPPPGPPPLSGHEQHQHDQEQQQYYPPPPPGPPPATTFSKQDEQQYYPPPPPGPPPNQLGADGHADAANQPPAYPSEPPPSYSDEFGEGETFVPDQKPPVDVPPALPPRPVSFSALTSASASGPSGLQAYFPPPPGSATQQPAAHGPASTGAVPSSSTGGKQYGGFGQKLYQWGVKASGPINKLTNKLGSEAFWPTTMDKECDKAARILKSFCKDGFYTSKSQQAAPSGSPSPGDPKSPGPRGESRALVKIPTSAIANAKGLAIFTTFRTGLHISGAGGSGVVVARLPDGSWSPPAGFLVHTLGAGFMIGLDIYDCVCVLNTQAAVDAFARRARVSLGGELAVVAGPVGAGGGLETAICGGGGKDGNGSRPSSSSSSATHEKEKTPNANATQRNKPVWSYMKSRGFYAGVQADGTVVIPRPDANAAFYGEREITVERILKGQVNSNPNRNQNQGANDLVMWPEGGRQLVEVLKAAEGKGADAKVMSQLGGQPTPGDLAASAPPGAAPPSHTGAPF